MQIAMSMSHKKLHHLAKERWENSLCLIKIVGMMFFLSISMITALFLSVGSIVVIGDFIMKLFF